MADVKIQKVPTPDEKTLPVFAEIEEIMSRIRQRAYELFAGQGFIEGRALDDWLAAEREICWPPAALLDRNDHYLFEIALAGFEPGEIEVTATPGELIVKAAHESKREPAAAEEREAGWSEFRSNEVYRRIEFPAPVIVDRLTAGYRNGLLKIVAPKAAIAEPESPRKVEIQAAA